MVEKKHVEAEFGSKNLIYNQDYGLCCMKDEFECY